MEVKHEPNATVKSRFFFFPCSPATLAVAQASKTLGTSQQRCTCWPWNVAANASICSASMYCRFLSDSVPLSVAALPLGSLLGKQGPPTYDGRRTPHVRGSRSQTISICSHRALESMRLRYLIFCLPAKRNSSTTWKVPRFAHCRMSITSSSILESSLHV